MRRRRNGSPALAQHIGPQLGEQGLRLRGIRNGQRAKGIAGLLRECGFSRVAIYQGRKPRFITL